MIHFRVLKNFFYALLASYIIQELIIYFIQSKPSSFGLGILIKGFDNLLFGIILWILLFASNLLIILLFQLWAYTRADVSPISSIKHSCDILAVIVIMSYYTFCFYFFAITANKSKLGYLTAMVLHLENVRLIMQSYSFLRVNIPKVLRHKSHSDNVLELPRMSNYLYFNFAPTLLYQDTYPRKKEINIKFALQCFFEMFCTIWLMSFIYEKYYMKLFQNSGLTKIDWTQYVLSVLNNIVCGFVIILCIFYILFHCWYNGVGELLRFADRQFYTEWWTSNDFSDLYRRWHIPVQDWLYFNIYRDIRKTLTPNNTFFPKMMVLLVSNVAHEYIILSILEQTFPMMFLHILSTIPFVFLKLKNPYFNILFLLSYGCSMNLVVHFYLMEHYTKLNCPPPKNDAFLQFMPRVFTADCHLENKMESIM